MQEPPYFNGISLGSTRYLRCVEAFENYFKAKGWSNKESLIIATQKL